MTITGKYEKDSNFTTIYSGNTMYTIARNTGDWACVKVGERTATNHILTQEAYDAWKNECAREGTFILDD